MISLNKHKKDRHDGRPILKVEKQRAGKATGRRTKFGNIEAEDVGAGSHSYFVYRSESITSRFKDLTLQHLSVEMEPYIIMVKTCLILPKIYILMRVVIIVNGQYI